MGFDFRTKLGAVLDSNGNNTGRILEYDWADSHGVLIAGDSNGDAALLANRLVTDAINHGFKPAVCCGPAKAADWDWLQPHVDENLWGVGDDVRVHDVLTALRELQNHCVNALIDYQVGRYEFLPDEVQHDMPPILLVCDDLASWATLDDDYARILPEDAQWRYQIHRSNAIICTELIDLAPNHGFRVLCISNTASEDDGVNSDMREFLDTRILMGQPRPTVRRALFHNKPVPANSGSAKNTGVAVVNRSNPVPFQVS